MGDHTFIILSSCYEGNSYILAHHKYYLQDILEDIRVDGVINHLLNPENLHLKTFLYFIICVFFRAYNIRPFSMFYPVLMPTFLL